jgi:hypothetical protein
MMNLDHPSFTENAFKSILFLLKIITAFYITHITYTRFSLFSILERNNFYSSTHTPFKPNIQYFWIFAYQRDFYNKRVCSRYISGLRNLFSLINQKNLSLYTLGQLWQFAINLIKTEQCILSWSHTIDPTIQIFSLFFTFLS